ncbi:hypothetical protein AVEN_21090-1 [Araneus ventricosus]|uniref:Uncharacterized protein n=1 Tax=Araneus ventricosus TaxID=182803 RepID=A0A4Y2TK66_ARAVE|nr:hypothetical protein AVEN_21090-1 [Araneus ventricosus]
MKADSNPLDYSAVNFEYSTLAFPQIDYKEFREFSSPRDENEGKTLNKISRSENKALGSSSNRSSIRTKPGNPVLLNTHGSSSDSTQGEEERRLDLIILPLTTNFAAASDLKPVRIEIGRNTI